MNERVRKLMQQAGTDTSGKWMGMEHTEKFVELILRECQVALSPMLRDMVSRGQAYELIRQHFGDN